MALVTSANIACGFHAGDPSTARAALSLAARHRVQVGAHPGFADRQHFGRRELERTPEQVFEECAFQIGGMTALAESIAQKLRHVKPHGALYNMACRDDNYALGIVEAAKMFGLTVMGLPGSQLEALSASHGCPFVAEGFADRRYLPNGSLVSRSRPDAFVEDPAEAVRQVEWLLRDQRVHTLCVHGDNPQALAFVRELRRHLEQRGVAIRPF
jgi:UPF0271 protein